ncbi:hypothetical protein ACWDRB_67305 [Nonomuraea sp. NPDC003707]
MLLFKAGLDDADKWSSIIGMSLTALIGVPATLYQVVLARRALDIGSSTTEVHITASGKRSIAAQTIGSASTGDGSSPIPWAAPSASSSSDSRSADELGTAPADSSAQVRVEAIGERSIAAQNIGSASTGDAPPPAAAG